MVASPNEVEIAKGTPTIVLAGQKWPIPLLAFRQNKIIVPIIMRFFRAMAANAGLFPELTEAVMNDLGTLAFTALSRAHTTLTRNEFEDLTIDQYELMAAVDVVAGQMMASKPGEAPGSMMATTSTSTTS